MVIMDKVNIIMWHWYLFIGIPFLLHQLREMTTWVFTFELWVIGHHNWKLFSPR